MSSDGLFGRGERLRLETTGAPLRGARQGMSWRLLGVMLLLTTLAALAGAALYAYSAGVRTTSGEAIAPLIKAEPGEVKHKPDDPGGLEPPHQDKLIFERVAPVQTPAPAEHLRPEPEEPLRSATAPEPEGEPVTWVAEDEAPPTPLVTPEAPPPQVATTSDPKPAQALETAGPAKPAASADTPAASEPAAKPAPPARAEKPAEAAKQEAALGGYRVQLASLRSEALAGRAWQGLLKSHGQLLQSLQHFIERADLGQERGIFYRVQVGPFPSKSEADALCAALRRQSASCFVVGGR